jgi:twitching motility protein PilT
MDYQREIEEIIEAIIAEEGSDIHLSYGRKPTLRIAGTLTPLLKKTELTREDTEGFLGILVTPENKQRFLENKELDFSYVYKDRARFRGNCFLSQGTVGIVMRLIPKKIKTLEELNLPDSLQVFAKKQQGFFLVVGPVGQGKSTTLASMIEIINQTRSEHIITIEDPVEYIYEQKESIIDQREVRFDTKDFATGLRSMFRQDVDVVLIGEMRGPETIGAAVTAAETGHLVFSTLHTNNAAQTIDRIIDSFPANQQEQIRVQLSESLTGIFSQRLVPKISGGMIPAYELLINNSAISNLIREKRTHEINTVIETSLEQGMITMDRSLAGLVREGVVSIEQARHFSENPNLLDSLI